MDEIPTCFLKGQVLTLQVGADQEAFDVVVERVHGTWTMSVTLIVKILENEVDMPVDDKPLFLKLYDRRYAFAFRDRWDAAPWTPQVEEDLLAFSQAGAARDVLDAWRDNPQAEYDFNAPSYHKEAILSEIMSKEFERESEAYSILQTHQGHRIPTLITTVVMQTGPADLLGDEPVCLLEDPEILGHSPELFEVNGFLFEYIRGFPASDIIRQTDPGDWEHLKNRCASVVGQVMTSPTILHEDIRPTNILVSPDEHAVRNYRVMMTDFRSCIIRYEETDQEWADMKRRYDEVGEIKAKLDNPPPRRKETDRADGYRVFTTSAWWNYDDNDVMTRE